MFDRALCNSSIRSPHHCVNRLTLLVRQLLLDEVTFPSGPEVTL
jgi:hypothetical protein